MLSFVLWLVRVAVLLAVVAVIVEWFVILRGPPGGVA